MKKRIAILAIYVVVVLAQSAAIAMAVKSAYVGLVIGLAIGSIALGAADVVLYIEKMRVLEKLRETAFPSEILEPTREMTDEEFHRFTERWNAVREDLRPDDGEA